jgi:hypothetical protein
MNNNEHQQLYYNGIVQEPVDHSNGDDQYTFAIN